MYDVVTIGETMLRLTPDSGLRWEQADSWQMHVGGSESNTAAGLSRLGLRVAWLSRLTNNPLGKKISRCLAGHGVDVGHVVWTDQDRIGTYYYEPASPPRDAAVLYDRMHSSFSRFSAEMLPADLFSAGKSRCLHFTGISLALGATTRQMIGRAVELARSAGWLISFDVNHRAKLMAAEEARPFYEQFIAQADIVFVPIRDARLLWGCSITDQRLSDDTRQAASQCLVELSPLAAARCLVLTLGSYGSAAAFNDQHYYASTTTVPTLGRLGTGDAFSAGFLSSWLKSLEPQSALLYGNAAACLKCSMPGDLPCYTRQEVDRLAQKKPYGDGYFR
jgi:2-dehydro-3-deoxygluconokinase